MTGAFSKHINRFAVAAPEKYTALTETACKVMSNTNWEITSHQYTQESETIEEEKTQSDEATSFGMEHPCKHEQRHEDTKQEKTSSKVGRNPKFNQKEIRQPLKA
ncbi:hypothetical protein BD560DRAFT_429839 [Blakeslea trispora]|nr:hypothetical protein BD560DRAFT_429839 [Blakeslea trispora]